MNVQISLKNIILLLIILLAISCEKSKTEKISHETKPEYLVDKRDISDLINFCMKSKSKIFKNCTHVWDQDPIFYFTEYDSLQITKQNAIFSKDDLAFIFKQALINPQLKLDSEIISEDKLVPLNIEMAFNRDRKIREEYLQENRNKYSQICTLSIPLFSRNKNVAIVKIGYSCGALCGEGGIYIYKKEKNGNWTLIKSISDWVS